MVNKKIKKLIMFLVVFTMFFIDFKVVKADTITCNYSDPDNGTGYAMKYNSEKSTLVPTITIQSKGNQSDIALISVEFNVADLKGSCPSNLYNLVADSESTPYAYDLKFFLNEDAAKTYIGAKGHEHWKYSIGTLLSLKNNTDFSKMDTCEYYEVIAGLENTNNKLIIYYDKNGKITPEVSIGGKFSSNTLSIKPDFSTITDCPVEVYSVANVNNVMEGTITVYLDGVKAKTASSNCITYTNSGKYGTSSDTSNINKIDDTDLDLGSGTITIDCSSFSALHTLYVIILVLAPIAVIVLGSIDYAKAVMASDEEKMKRFKSKLPKRIIALVLLFLTPFIVNGIIEVFLGGKASTMLCITKGYSDPITIQSSSEKSTSVLDNAPADLKSACSSACSSISPTAEIECTKTCVSNYDKTCQKVASTSDRKKCYKNYAKSYKPSSNK